MGLDFKLFGQFVPGSDLESVVFTYEDEPNSKWQKCAASKRSEILAGIIFHRLFPEIPENKVRSKRSFSDGLTMTAPRVSRDVAYFRSPSYKK